MRKQELHPRTAVVNQKQKNLSKRARLDALFWLAEKFPLAFDNTSRIQPLSIGIMTDILAHADSAHQAGISTSKLRQAVVLFTRRVDYLTCLKAREMRINLNGEIVSQVTEEEAAVAALKIKKRVEKSAKMARQNLSETLKPLNRAPVSPPPVLTPSAEFVPYYPDRAPAFSVQNSVTPSARTTSVTVIHKQARTYDPAAVARLKEKLGLSRKEVEETSK